MNVCEGDDGQLIYGVRDATRVTTGHKPYSAAHRGEQADGILTVLTVTRH